MAVKSSHLSTDPFDTHFYDDCVWSSSKGAPEVDDVIVDSSYLFVIIIFYDYILFLETMALPTPFALHQVQLDHTTLGVGLSVIPEP
jgi:hypothetical protein